MQDKRGIFDNPKNVKLLLKIFFTACVIIFLVDLVISKHPHFEWEEWTGFYAVFGFVACVILVLVAKYVLRPIVMRKEDYYD